MKYESCILNGLKVMAKVKVFVHAHTDTDARAMTLAPKTFTKLANNYIQMHALEDIFSTNFYKT